jgi:thiol-disulfide isomerase/thioredoxin
MTPKNKIKVIGSDNCEDCLLLLTILEDYVKEKDLNIEIEKIQSISDEAIDLALEFEINKIPFAIFNKKKIVFNKKTNRSHLKDFFA